MAGILRRSFGADQHHHLEVVVTGVSAFALGRSVPTVLPWSVFLSLSFPCPIFYSPSVGWQTGWCSRSDPMLTFPFTCVWKHFLLDFVCVLFEFISFAFYLFCFCFCHSGHFVSPAHGSQLVSCSLWCAGAGEIAVISKVRHWRCKSWVLLTGICTSTVGGCFECACWWLTCYVCSVAVVFCCSAATFLWGQNAKTLAYLKLI